MIVLLMTKHNDTKTAKKKKHSCFLRRRYLIASLTTRVHEYKALGHSLFFCCPLSLCSEGTAGFRSYCFSVMVETVFRDIVALSTTLLETIDTT